MLKDKLKYLRSTRNLTQKELGKSVGVAQQTVNSWENGRTRPKHEELTSLADFFGVSIDWLMGRDDFLTPPTATDEVQLLSGYRKLNPANKQSVVNMVDFLNSPQNSGDGVAIQSNNNHSKIFNGNNNHNINM